MTSRSAEPKPDGARTEGARSAAHSATATGRGARGAFRSIEPERRRLADEVYRQVLEAVLAGSLAPGERIVQEQIASEINVSRTPVREALLHLEREGILVRAGVSGFAVREISAHEVRDVYQAREAIEGHAARLVAERRDPAALARIERTIATEQSMRAGGVEAYFHANRRIHRCIVETAGNEYLLRSFDGIWNRSFSFRLFAAIERFDRGASLREHEALLAAMRDRPPAAAGEAMVVHIREGLGLQLQALGEGALGVLARPRG